LKRTPKALRKRAFLAVAVRSGEDTGYELRAFPGRHKFQLIRRPSGGGSEFPVGGTESKIRGVGKANVLRVAAFGNRVTAKINGNRVARVTDPDAAQVNGQKVEVAIGNKKRSHRSVLASVDDLKLQVPKP